MHQLEQLGVRANKRERFLATHLTGGAKEAALSPIGAGELARGKGFLPWGSKGGCTHQYIGTEPDGQLEQLSERAGGKGFLLHISLEAAHTNMEQSPVGAGELAGGRFLVTHLTQGGS